MARKTSYTQALTEASSTAKEAVGTIRDEGQKVYKYIVYAVGAGNIAGTAGRIVGYFNPNGYALSKVTADVSDTFAAAGQLMATLTDGQFGWIQIMGRSEILATDVVSGALGNVMTISSTTDGTAKVVGAVTDTVLGFYTNTGAAAQRIALTCPR